MNFEHELRRKHMNIHALSVKSGIPYATLYPIVKGQVDIGTCSYNTVEKLADALGYRPDEIVYRNEDFQTFRNNLHHRIKKDDLGTILAVIERKNVEYYTRHEDYLKAMYLVATVDYISKMHGIPLNNAYDSIRSMKLPAPYYVGDSVLFKEEETEVIDEFARFNIYEGSVTDAV